MYIKRSLIGTEALDKALELHKKGCNISSIYNMLGIYPTMRYRTAFNIIMADIAGHKAVRPEWLRPTPLVQKAPGNARLVGGLEGQWRVNL